MKKVKKPEPPKTQFHQRDGHERECVCGLRKPHNPKFQHQWFCPEYNKKTKK